MLPSLFRSACGSLGSEENFIPMPIPRITPPYSSQKKIISRNIPHRLNGKPGLRGRSHRPELFTKKKPLIPPSQKNSGMFSVILVKPQRNSAIYDPTGPVASPGIAIPEKPPVTSPVAIKTELMAKCRHQPGFLLWSEDNQIPFFFRSIKCSFHLSYDNCISFLRNWRKYKRTGPYTILRPFLFPPYFSRLFIYKWNKTAFHYSKVFYDFG